ncbi:unnamed protein product [Mesocestoides corti]|uniref:Uncharacterized protein n=1 Tax=Mesocestoides corti TaxID=53468 RepID=A0A0R3UIS3_MESCO|nr:unnamed protein product [Mesocestoides corti]
MADGGVIEGGSVRDCDDRVIGLESTRLTTRGWHDNVGFALFRGEKLLSLRSSELVNQDADPNGVSPSLSPQRTNRSDRRLVIPCLGKRATFRNSPLTDRSYALSPTFNLVLLNWCVCRAVK